MEDKPNCKEKSNEISNIISFDAYSNHEELSVSKSKLFYDQSQDIKQNNEKDKGNISCDYYTEQIKITFNSIDKKIDEIMHELKCFKQFSESIMISLTEETQNSKLNNINNKIISNIDNVNNLAHDIFNKKNSYNNLSKTMDKINDISTKITKLDSLINSNFEFIKTRIKDIKISKEEENTENENNSNNISFQISLKEINNSLDDNIDNINISKNIFIHKAESKFGLDNQFELVKYNKNNNLLINVNNYNSLILRLIRTYDSEIINTLIIQNIFPDDIREIRYYSSEFKINTEDNNDNSKDNNINDNSINIITDVNINNKNNIFKNETKNFLLVSSQKNELKIFEVLMVDYGEFENILKEISHIENIYQKPYKYINQDFFDLSSCVLRLIKDDLYNSEIYTTCWEGNSIKVYNIFTKECKTEIESKTSCNIKYCNLVEDKYLLFCGCNKQDNYTCVNRININMIDFSKYKNKDINFIKYRDECIENKENVHFNLYYYKTKNEKYIITCDEKGYLRMFNFDNQKLIYKIYPSLMNKNLIYDETNLKIRRLNSIIEWNKNYLLITERNTGYIYLVKINTNEEIKLQVKNCFNLYDTEVISIREYLTNEFLVLGKDMSSMENDIDHIEMIKKIRIEFNN